jgi:hypothetical protein
MYFSHPYVCLLQQYGNILFISCIKSLGRYCNETGIIHPQEVFWMLKNDDLLDHMLVLTLFVLI